MVIMKNPDDGISYGSIVSISFLYFLKRDGRTLDFKNNFFRKVDNIGDSINLRKGNL